MFKYLFLILVSLTCIAQVGEQLSEEEQRIKDELINKYGDKKQISTAELKESIRVQIDTMSFEIFEFKKKFTEVGETLKNSNLPSQISNGLTENSERLADFESRLNEIDEIVSGTGSPSRINEQKKSLDNLQIDFNAYKNSIQKITDASHMQGGDLEKQLESFPKDILGSSEDVKLEDNIMTKFMDDAMKSALARFKTDSPFKNMSKDEIRNFITSASDMTAVGALIKKSPTFTAILVEIFHDKEAMPKLVSLVEKQKEMKTFFYISITLLVLSMIMNMMNKKGNIFKRILKKIIITLGTLCLNLGIFYFMFQEEVGPTVRAMGRVLL